MNHFLDKVMRIKTVAYKGSKRKLLNDIEFFARAINANTFFDGFSGTGIVSAHMRAKGYTVYANDISESSRIYGVFLAGYDLNTVSYNHIKDNRMGTNYLLPACAY